jgi:hypothetical protein
MAKHVTADDILPLIACLTPGERVRLIRLISEGSAPGDAAMYAAAPPAPDEFSDVEDPLAWDAEGWEGFD